MSAIEIYTTRFCPYCIMAKRLLNKKGVRYQEYAVDGKPELRAEMVKRAGGRTTVPQIFINGRHIGGCDDLTMLDMDGKLDSVLAQVETG